MAILKTIVIKNIYNVLITAVVAAFIVWIGLHFFNMPDDYKYPLGVFVYFRVINIAKPEV